jgi:hypothetical protein
VPYLDNYWSDSFGPKYDPPVFGVLHFPKYSGNLSNFISHASPKFQKTSVIDRGNTKYDVIISFKTSERTSAVLYIVYVLYRSAEGYSICVYDVSNG